MFFINKHISELIMQFIKEIHITRTRHFTARVRERDRERASERDTKIVMDAFSDTPR